MTTNPRLRTKKITLKAVRANAGIAQAYEDALIKWINEMNKSVLYWVKAQYRANKPALAQDDQYGSIYEGSSANAMNLQVARLARRWQRNFDQGAKTLAEWFSTNVLNRSQKQLKDILRDAGFSVEFKMTDAARDAYGAVINENIALIKSIPSQYFTQVQGDVMRAVSRGGDLGPLAEKIEKQYGVTKRRAALISRDQNRKANSVITRVRQQELGITTAVWKHSRAGAHPRPSHQAADGKEYDVTKGMLIDGEYVFPGELINCKCYSKSVIEGFIE